MRLMRVAAILATLLAGAIAPIPALGHAGLESSTPADGSTLTRAPSEVRLVFGGELVPDGTEFTVVDESGAVVGEGVLDLDVADRNEVSGAIAIEASGSYTVRWSSTALDGHHEEGELEFTLDAGPEAASPDTALIPPGTDLSVGGGILLLYVALGLVMRQGRERS